MIPRHPRHPGAPLARGRREFVAGLCLLTFAAVARAGASNDVPAELQAELLAKVVRYDRNFDKRSGDLVVALIVVKPKSAESAVAGNVTRSAFGRIDTVGGKPHRETLVDYRSAGALAEAVRREHASIVYVTAGLESEVPAIAAALGGVDVLTVAGSGDAVGAGVVLGFELVLGKPKMVLNLPQARKQNVDFGADVLRLMKVQR